MKKVLGVLAVALAISAGMSASAQPTSTFTIVDTLATATPADTFTSQVGGMAVWSEFFFGPRFVLAQPTVINEIGGFVDTPGEAMAVQVVPADANGLPDMGRPIAFLLLTDDGQRGVVSYEFVQPDLTLEPGTYFALFMYTAQDGVGGVLANAENYQADTAAMGIWCAWWDPQVTVVNYQAAVRILGELAMPTSKDQCKNDGWRHWPQFKNQGACVSYVETHK
jgi:hypothetical protein